MIISSDELFDSINPESSPIVHSNTKISSDLLFSFEKSSLLPDPSHSNDESQLQPSNLDELISQCLCLTHKPSNFKNAKKKKVIKSAVFQPFSSLENTEITVKSLKSFFKH